MTKQPETPINRRANSANSPSTLSRSLSSRLSNSSAASRWVSLVLSPLNMAFSHHVMLVLLILCVPLSLETSLV
ncbi:hypothetical protein CWS02_16080 [Enterobacter sp. EA-1]|nr:hypothetical protein CWS02_16080 [Enterobacter sp. EA-1]